MIVLNKVNSIPEPELAKFCKNFFQEITTNLQNHNETFSVHAIRTIYQKLLDAGDSPNLPPTIDTKELAEKLSIQKVRESLQAFVKKYDPQVENIQSVSDYSKSKHAKIQHIITNLYDFADLWAFGKHSTDDPILELEYFRHGRFYEDILEYIVIIPMKSMLSVDTDSDTSILHLSRFAYDLATSELETISDSANKALETFTPWNGGMPQVIEDFRKFCRKESNAVLSHWILEKGNLCLKQYSEIDQISSPLHGPTLHDKWEDVFELIRKSVQEVHQYYHAISGHLGTNQRIPRPVSNSNMPYHETNSSVHSNDTSLPGQIQRLFTERVEILPKIGKNNVSESLPDSNYIIVLLLRYIIKGALELSRLLEEVNLHQTQLDIYRFKDFMRKSHFNKKEVIDDSGLNQLLDDWLNTSMVRSADPSLLEDSALDLIIHRGQ